MKTLFLFTLSIVFLTSCSDEALDPNLSIEGSLQAEISQNSSLVAINELVACAAGGQKGFLEDATLPTNIFFYPELNARDFKYYKTENTVVDPLDLNQYKEVNNSTSLPVFNGFLERFPLPKASEDFWTRVSFIANDTLWYSKAIKVQTNTRPTEFNPNLSAINLERPTAPIFTWEDGIYKDNFIYFHLVSDDSSNALSGTYTNEKRFQYYNLDNVVFNVTREGQALPLIEGNSYHFTLMGVSEDNWVNLILQKEFIAE